MTSADDAFPEPGETRAAALTKLAADLSRIPKGSVVRLILHSGETRTGVKIVSGANGIGLDGCGHTSFDEVAGYESPAT